MSKQLDTFMEAITEGGKVAPEAISAWMAEIARLDGPPKVEAIFEAASFAKFLSQAGPAPEVAKDIVSALEQFVPDLERLAGHDAPHSLHSRASAFKKLQGAPATAPFTGPKPAEAGQARAAPWARFTLKPPTA